MNAAPNEPLVVRRIDWRELFPWLILLRVFRVAIAPAHLVLASLAILLSSAGWWLSGYAFLTPVEFAHIPPPHLAGVAWVPRGRQALQIPLAASEYLPAQTERVLTPFASLAAPVARLLDDETPGAHVAYYVLGLLMSLAVWAYVGGVISRQALIELGCEQSSELFDTLSFVARRYLQYFVAPLAPLLALALLGLLFVPLGWLMRLDVGLFLAGLAWIFVVLAGLLAAWLTVGLLFGWPMMFGAVGSRRDGDALQAFSDVYSYVYGKPLRYFFYAVVAVSLGVLALTVVQIFAELTIEFGFWATSWGAGAERMAVLKRELNALAAGQPLGGPASRGGGVQLIAFALSLVQVVATAAAYSYFFVASTAIFLLMRLAVDEKEMDEVHLDEEDAHLETARRAMLSDETTPEEEPATRQTMLAPDSQVVSSDTVVPEPPSVDASENPAERPPE
jgi:hypothetical protein